MPIKKGTKSIFRKLGSSMQKHNVTVRDTASTLNLTIESNKKRFSPYQGKIIRSIKVQQLNFYQSIDDTTSKKKYFGTQLLTKFHRTTRSSIIRNNLFIKEGDVFYATVAADNERFLRTISYIRDARLNIDSVPGTDSIDIVVVTKDLFSITGSMGSFSSSRVRASVAEYNLGGLGQSIYYSGSYENDRRPTYDASFGYRYNNLFGTFADLTAYTSNIGKNIITGDRNESFQSIEISRPLFSQYKRFMGGISLNHASTRNVYPNLIEQNRYFDYKYTTFDIWGGVNMNVKRYIEDEKNHLRQFLALRYVKYTFHNAPEQIITPFDMRTNTREMALAQFTLFKQDFYQTRYFYNFGTVEDIPYGFNYNLTAGWYRQRRSSRPYLGMDLNNYMLTQSGDIFQFFARGGMFIKNGVQDAGYVFGSTFYSRVMPVGETKVRQVLRASYSEVFNTVTTYPLRINNYQFGLNAFSSDSVVGSRRLSLHSETRFFTPCKILGFILSPYLSSDLSFLTPMKGAFERSSLYIGIGPGLRIRNENLVFGTIEIRSMYFPRQIQGQNSFKIGMSANLRFRFNTNYVNKPDLYNLNDDPNSTIY
ncbi:MAG: hypothetical protein DI598_12500 [Pseudopedobacter saltans]|uniref:Outer membrane protein beta-barrel domain-containing protein n=1 Tax=Pseudopedobacter saltans TaxID=151895 RepID=A0A2W5EPW7_9SPHI|nr:MAG: hypothetical protein DI598_12500 [Pseudopedobacter saltans]